MHAYKGTPGIAEGDEYVSVWLQDKDEEYATFRSDVCDLLLLHGYKEKYETANDEVQAVADQIQQAIESANVKLDAYGDEDLYVLYHGPRAFILTSDDLAPAFGRRAIKVARYSSVPDRDASILGPWVDHALKQLEFSQAVIDRVQSFRSTAAGGGDQPRPSGTLSARREAFSHLKHHITQLFLPLSIDIQGMESVEGLERLAYAADIIKERAMHKSLIQRFSQLRILIAKVHDTAGKTLSTEAPNFSVWDWLTTFGVEGDATISLLTLSGLVLKAGRPAVDSQSQVANYFAAIDGTDQAADLWPAMTQPFQLTLRNNGQSQRENLTFAEWLNRLDSVLDKLRTALLEVPEDDRDSVIIGAG
jgi:hypothetical protein